MNYIILDLEWNCVFNEKQDRFFNEIIEVGAVKADESLTASDRFSSYIRPEYSKQLTSYVASLTKIEYTDLMKAPSFSAVMKSFTKWAGQDAVIMTWSTTDLNVLIDNFKTFKGIKAIPFLKSFCNLQKYTQQRLGAANKNQMGLDTAARQLGLLDAEDNSHRALDDSALTLEIFKKVYDGKLEGYIQEADKRFYDRLLYKNLTLSNINDPLINKRRMRSNCPDCSKPARRVTDWKYKKPYFSAMFICAACKHKFFCRIQFKLKHEGMTVKKQLQSVITNDNQRMMKS